MSNQTRFDLPLSEYGLIKEKLAIMEADAYAIESMTYYCAALEDTFDQQDIEMEVAATKVFNKYHP